MYTTVRTYFQDSNLKDVTPLGGYADGRGFINHHTSPKSAAVDFGERIGMLSRNGLVYDEIVADNGFVEYTAEYDSGITVQISMS